MPSPIENRPAKVMWAVDPFHDQPRIQLRSFEALAKLFGKAPMQVQPVAVLKLGKYDPARVQDEPKWRGLAEEAAKRINGLTSVIKHPGLLPTHFEKMIGGSTFGAAMSLLRYAIDEGAQMLVVSSHGRKGAERMLLGSFAESLVLKSPIPVLVVNPASRVKSVPRIKNILFPTDFSDSSYEAFSRTVLIARALRLPIRLFHKVEYLYPEVGPAFFYPAVSSASVKELRTSVIGLAQPWLNYAKQFGVKATFQLDHGGGRPLDEILGAAKKLGPATLIAIASQSNRAEALLMGSVTRQLLRESTAPVLVVHPNDESVVKRFVDEARLYGYDPAVRPMFF